MLSPCKVVEENDLGVIGALADFSNGTISRTLGLCRVNIDDLTITFISKEEALLRARVDSEVRCGVEDGLAGVPSVPGQVGFLGL